MISIFTTVFVYFCLAHFLPAQPTVPTTTLRTGAGMSLVSERRTLDLTDTNLTALEFGFGFGTDEQAGPGTFFDSIAGSLQSVNNNSLGTIYFTADAHGFRWAPPTPGNIPMNENSIGRSSINFPIFDRTYSTQTAFSVSALIPSELRGQIVDFHFDLFDNQNSIDSLAWLSEITPIPEPSVGLLSVIGLLLLFKFKRTQ